VRSRPGKMSVANRRARLQHLGFLIAVIAMPVTRRVQSLMASVIDNYDMWNDRYKWPQQGDEWSEPWGGPDPQWRHTVLPRISALLPAATILEIAPGHGRWTQFLHAYCRQLIVVDVSPTCIDVCRRRFSHLKHLEYITNDGKSLDAIEDTTIDFLFSFDSLVHADPDVINSYLSASARKLKPGGFGFIHHSNLGHYRHTLPNSLEFDEHWRSRNMTSDIFSMFCHSFGMCCLQQELVNWLSTGRLLDCFSTFANTPCSASEPASTIKNWDFMREAVNAKLDAIRPDEGHAASPGICSP